mgnify:CR=1 FL=1
MNSLKKFIIKKELNFLYFFLLLAIFNNVSHFVRKNLLGDRIDFWDFHVYWCSANKFINGINPYGGETIKNCLSQFNFDLYFSYPPIVLKFLSFLGYFDLNTAKIIWISIVGVSFLTIIIYLKKIYQIPRIIFFTLLLIFTGGGLVWGALIAGNISVILYAILSVGIYYYILKRTDIYYLSVSIISLFKFPFLIFFVMPIFLNGFKWMFVKNLKEIKKIFFYFTLTLFIYFLQFYFDKELFMSFINSTISYKGEGFLSIHGTGIGIHGIIDLYQNILYEKYILNFFNPSGTFSFLIHLSISGILFISSYCLFSRPSLDNGKMLLIPNTFEKYLEQEKLLISFFIVIFLCCFPRISSYDFYLLIPSFFYIMRNSRIRLLTSNWNLIASLLTISVLAIYDTRYPAFVISFVLLLFFYLQIKHLDPFYLIKDSRMKSQF